MILYILSMILLVMMSIFFYYSIKFNNPYKLIMIFGKKGCGKSTNLMKLAIRYTAKGWKVYSTERLPLCEYVPPEKIGFVALEPHSVLLVDEVGMIWNNRDFKKFKPEVRDWFKLQRHYRVRVYLFSQTFDIDLALRNLCDSMYMLFNVGGVISYGKQIKRKLVVVKPSAEAEARITDDLLIPPFFLAPFGARMFTWIPRYAKFFDSHITPELPVENFETYEVPKQLRKYIRKYEKCRSRKKSKAVC